MKKLSEGEVMCKQRSVETSRRKGGRESRPEGKRVTSTNHIATSQQPAEGRKFLQHVGEPPWVEGIRSFLPYEERDHGTLSEGVVFGAETLAEHLTRKVAGFCGSICDGEYGCA